MNAQNKRVLLMLPVLAVAAWLALFGDKTPDGEVAEPTTTRPAAEPAAAPVTASEAVAEVPAATPVNQAAAEGEVLRVRPRDALRGMIDGPDVHDLFAPLLPPQAVAAQQPQEAVQPPPPVLPFVYIGREETATRRVYFLEKAGQTFVLAAGDRAEGFQLETASDRELTLVDLATKTKHVIPIGGE